MSESEYKFWQSNIKTDTKVDVVGKDAVNSIDLDVVKGKLTKARTRVNFR